MTHPSAASLGESCDIVGDVLGNGYADFVMGDSGVATSWVFAGSPVATWWITGTGCGAGVSPILLTFGTPIIGTTVNFQVFGATPNQLSTLWYGIEDPIGTTICGGSCTVYLLLTPPPAVFANFTTSPTGTATIPLVIPTSLALIGVQVAFQGQIGIGACEFTNANVHRFGW